MRYLLLFFALGLIHSVNAQKVKIDDDIAYVDDVEYCKYVRKNMANEADIKGMNADRDEIFMSFQSYIDPNEVSKSNPEGKVRWIELNFLELGIKCEVQSNTHKWIVKLLWENNIFVDGKLDPEAARRIVSKYGTRFTDNRRNGNINIIINN